MSYTVVTSKNNIDKFFNYLTKVNANVNVCGEYYRNIIVNNEYADNLDKKSLIRFQQLLNTKRPQIFAESQIVGNGVDWNNDELSILGDVSVCIDVTVYDDGNHITPKVHDKTFEATLMYVPGVILANNGLSDYQEVVNHGKLDYNKFRDIYIRRLVPVLKYANDHALGLNKKALITMPAIGCGVFSGNFGKDTLKDMLVNVMKHILSNYMFENIEAIIFDPFISLKFNKNESYEFNHTKFMIKPSILGGNKQQLANPNTMINSDHCRLYSIVAWDHVAWPGNDFYIDSRMTDDGVKSAATNMMFKITNIKGDYDKRYFKYLPPRNFFTWEDVVKHYKLSLNCKNLKVYNF